MCYMDKKEEEGKEEGVNLVNWLNKVHNEERRRKGEERRRKTK